MMLNYMRPRGCLMLMCMLFGIFNSLLFFKKSKNYTVKLKHFYCILLLILSKGNVYFICYICTSTSFLKVIFLFYLWLLGSCYCGLKNIWMIFIVFYWLNITVVIWLLVDLILIQLRPWFLCVGKGKII